MSTPTSLTPSHSTTGRRPERIALRLHPDWPPVLLPEGVLPQVALDVTVTPVPACAPWFRGVIGRRGAVVPVFDIPASVGLLPALLRSMRIVVLDPGAEAIALLCTEVPGLVAVEGAASALPSDALPDRLAAYLDPPLICGGQVLATFAVRRWLAAHAPLIAR